MGILEKTSIVMAGCSILSVIISFFSFWKSNKVKAEVGTLRQEINNRGGSFYNNEIRDNGIGIKFDNN